MTSFEEVADLLSGSLCEVQYRTVASRAYYAVFNLVLPIVDKAGFSPVNTGDVHQQLNSFLKKSSEVSWRTLGYSRLPRLRALRNRADYQRTAAFTREHAAEAAGDALEVEELLRAWVAASKGIAPLSGT